MVNELTEDQQTSFRSLQAAYKAFYEARNHPADGVDYEDWQENLDLNQAVEWIERMQDKAISLQKLIKQNQGLSSYRPFHEIRSFFHEDLRSLERELTAENYVFDVAGIFSAQSEPTTGSSVGKPSKPGPK